ncbi:MAG: hypothetical protein IT323_16380 [Anaerolineae bacterium]|nr:hypothetical protein [Anaerolineae bacterium]
MADQIVLTLPEEISARARRIAETTSRPVEQVLIEHLQTLAAPQAELPPDERAELDALAHLSNDALWTIAREQMPDEVQARAHELMDRNARGQLSPSEIDELDILVQRADRLMLRKAEAASLLAQRGQSFRQEDFTTRDE